MRTTKHKLWYSALSLLLCLALLMGTTFAWFTDSVRSANNIITAGNLDLEMYWTDDPDSGVWHNVEDAAYNTIFSYDNWEPGYTDVKYVKLVNAGDLALNYQLMLTPESGVGKLAEVINVFYAEGAVDVDGREDLSKLGAVGLLDNVLENAVTANGTLLAEGQVSPLHPSGEVIVTVAMSMITSAGNEYQSESVGNFTVTALATQCPFEQDSFGSDYDSGASFPQLIRADKAFASVNAVDGKVPAGGVSMQGDKVSATVPAGVKLADGVSELKLTVTPLENTTSGIVAVNNEMLIPVDVHIEGVAQDNDVPVIIDLGAVLPPHLNMGNYVLIHVENGANSVMTAVADRAQLTEHNRFTYDPVTGEVSVAMASFSEIALLSEPAQWKGNRDYSWYDASKNEFEIANADQLAGFGAIVGGMEGQTRDSFAGKTVKLTADINLGYGKTENNPIFYPIGYNSDDGKYEKTEKAITSSLKTFEGTFDGQGHTVSNFYHNTWEMKGDNEYYDRTLQYYRDGMGLFGRVYNGIVKNLTVKNFSSDGEYTTTGCIAAYADGATFENIAIIGCNPRVYNIGNGGIVGCVGWYAKEEGLKTTFKNITVDNTNKISALWGSYDVACGGIVGQYYPTSGQTSAGNPTNSGVYLQNCHVSAQMDVYNDVCANYQYYAYRYAGMIIGSIRENATNADGKTVPDMTGISAEGCTVNYGDWNDYYYCELVDNSLASYTHDHQFSRLVQVEEVIEENGIYTYIPLGGGAPINVPESGRANYVVVNKDAAGNYLHATENATCYHFKDGKVWIHEDGGHEEKDVNGDGIVDSGLLKEDKQHYHLPFYQLFTGYGWGVNSIGLEKYSGIVTNLDIAEGDQQESVKKFEGNGFDNVVTGAIVTLGELFTLLNTEVELMSSALTVTLTNEDDTNHPVKMTFVRDSDNWANGTVTFTGTGAIYLTIQDYYFCEPTTIRLSVTEPEPVERFDTVLPNVKTYLYRVGNGNAVPLKYLFKAQDDEVGTVNVTVKPILGNASATMGTLAAEWENTNITFSGTGVLKLTIQDNNNSIPYSLYLEVVNATNAYTNGGSLNATANDVVLMQNMGFGEATVSSGHTLWGNGFELTCASDRAARDMSYSFVELDGGTLDNVRVIVPNFSHAILYSSNASEGNNPTDADGRYYNIRSAVVMKGSSKITNSYVSGGRAAVYVSGGSAAIENSTIVGGAVANIHVALVNSVLLKDTTLVQKPMKATVNNTSKTLMGFSVLITCDESGQAAPITIEGEMVQYAWVNENYAQYVPTAGKDIIDVALKQTAYLHDINGDGTNESLNLGFTYVPASIGGATNPNVIDNRTNKTAVPYDTANLTSGSITFSKVYSYKNTKGTDAKFLAEPTYTATTQGAVRPTVSYNGEMNGCTFKTSYDVNYGWGSTLTVDLDTVGTYSFSFSNLLAQKFGNNLSYTITDTAGNAVNLSAAVSLTNTVSHQYVLHITDTLFYDAQGKPIAGKTTTHSHRVSVVATKTSYDPPKLTLTGGAALPIAKNQKNSDWTAAFPALENMTVRYWSTTEGRYKEATLDTLIDWNGISLGKQAVTGTNGNVWTYEGADFTLTITGGTIKSNPTVYTVPVVVNRNNAKQLYFVSSNSTDGMVSNGTSARSSSLTYTFTDKNNASASGSKSWTVTYSTDVKNKDQYKYDDFCKGTLTKASSCVTPDTLITLADGTQKRIDQVTYADQLLVWDFYKGEYTVMPSSIVMNHGYGEYTVVTLNFDDGTCVKTINGHGFFAAAENRFVIISKDNVSDYVGHTFVKDAAAGTTVKLISYSISTQYTESWSVLTAVHYNCLLEGMLTITPAEVEGSPAYLMPYEIKDMQYVKQAMQADIDKYGLYTYEDFAQYMTYEQFTALNLAHFKVSVAKGYITWDDIMYLISIHLK